MAQAVHPVGKSNMNFVKGFLLTGLVISAGAAGYTTLQGTWWSLALAVLSAAGFWLAIWQIQSWCGTSRKKDIAKESEDLDSIFLNQVLQSRRYAGHPNSGPASSRRKGPDQRKTQPRRNRPAA
jgi:hypothetical protein